MVLISIIIEQLSFIIFFIAKLLIKDFLENV